MIILTARVTEVQRRPCFRQSILGNGLRTSSLFHSQFPSPVFTYCLTLLCPIAHDTYNIYQQHRSLEFRNDFFQYLSCPSPEIEHFRRKASTQPTQRASNKLGRPLQFDKASSPALSNTPLSPTPRPAFSPPPVPHRSIGIRTFLLLSSAQDFNSTFFFVHHSHLKIKKLVISGFLLCSVSNR